MKVAEIQNVELPTWFIMESKGDDAWLRQSRPMNEEREVDEHEEVTYAIASQSAPTRQPKRGESSSDDGGRVASIHSSQIAG